jgi:hypothetical protein
MSAGNPQECLCILSITSQTIPNILRYLRKRFDYLWIKLPAAAGCDFFSRRLIALPRAIGKVRCDRIERVCDRDNPGAQRNLFAL